MQRKLKGMNIQEVKIAKYFLSKEIGWSWPIVMIKCMIRKNDIFKSTHWSKEKGAESNFVQRLPIVSAMFLELQNRYDKDKAFEIMKKIIVPIGLNESLTSFRMLNIAHKNPLESLKIYFNYIDEKGAGRFCNRHYSKENAHICHRMVTKCPFHGFFIEAGTPELTKLFCDVDIEFYAKAFPELNFHRGSSWENTIAYGKDHCDFIFKQKDIE